MNSLAFGNRLVRDLDVEGLVELTSDARQELLDAINGGLQVMDLLSPHHTHTATASLYLEPSVTVTIGVTQGSSIITGTTFIADQYGRTVHVSGDTIENQIVSDSELLHPYGGATGSATAVVYSDAVAFPEPYIALAGNPTILETKRELLPCHVKQRSWSRKHVAEPRFYWVEANARNRNSIAPAVIRFDTLPDRAYRIQVDATIAPTRIEFTDLLSSSTNIPVREDHVESVLLPIVRGILTSSSLWKDKDSRVTARDASKEAQAMYSALVSPYLFTHQGRVGSREGY